MTNESENAATIAAIPAEYITATDRGAYVARARAGEDVYAYCNATKWIIWDGAIADRDRRVVYGRRADAVCTCCRATECGCGAWRCELCGHCLVPGHCRHFSSDEKEGES